MKDEIIRERVIGLINILKDELAVTHRCTPCGAEFDKDLCGDSMCSDKYGCFHSLELEKSFNELNKKLEDLKDK